MICVLPDTGTAHPEMALVRDTGSFQGTAVHPPQNLEILFLL
ncbi:hypothetical protein [Zongyangia hominis]|nr:hypothetical protein [Zongyangia hominis]